MPNFFPLQLGFNPRSTRRGIRVRRISTASSWQITTAETIVRAVQANTQCLADRRYRQWHCKRSAAYRECCPRSKLFAKPAGLLCGTGTWAMRIRHDMTAHIFQSDSGVDINHASLERQASRCLVGGGMSAENTMEMVLHIRAGQDGARSCIHKEVC